jgi:hypothetical protein
MSTSPQAVTERYVSNLLHYGRNKEFDILTSTQNQNKIGEESVGVYYHVTVQHAGSQVVQRANGATPAEAVRRALTKLGVTFR